MKGSRLAKIAGRKCLSLRFSAFLSETIEENIVTFDKSNNTACLFTCDYDTIFPDFERNEQVLIVPAGEVVMAKNRYARDYELLEDISPDGRFQTHVRYKGDYYRFVSDGQQVERMKRRCVICFVSL